MATLDDSVLDNLRELNALRDRTKQLRERGRKALSGIPTTKLDYEKLARDCDLSNDQWVSGPHPIDLALLVRVLNHRDLGDYEYSAPDQLTETLAAAVERRFPEDKDDLVPILTAARAMHALIGTPQTVFSKATMLCYYRIVRELYLATFPNWIIGAARAGEGGRVSAFVTGECVRAILAFRDAIGNTITFLSTAKRLFEEHERLQHMPNVDDYLQMRSRRNNSHWKRSLEIEYERLALDWYAANNLRRNVIALDLSGRKKKHPGGDTKDTTHSIESLLPAFFPLNGERRIGSRAIRQALDRLPKLLMVAIKRGQKNITAAISSINKFRETERTGKTDSDRFRATVSAHDLALKVITEAFYEANDAATAS